VPEVSVRGRALAVPGNADVDFGESRDALPVRVVRGLWHFAKRKPLGAFGGILLLTPVVMAIVLPGLDLGIVQLPRILKYGPEDYELGRDVLAGPSWDHPMGTDQLGRDLFARLLYGSRMSYIIGWSVFAISSTLSTSLTIISAYYVRTVDLIMQRVIEIIGFLPDLILLIALFSIYGATPLTLILTLGVLNGITTGRVLRALVIQVRAMPYIEAARALGASDRRIIFKHVLPQLVFLIIITATGGLAAAVLAESGLAILGFGISPTYPTLGNLLNGSRQFLRVAPHLALFPGLVIFMLLLGSRLLGDALRDVLDPRLRGSR
jgi:peptide/nickel transport system permease protein